MGIQTRLSDSFYRKRLACNTSPQQCRLIGDIAARLHLAVADFEPFMNNPRNADWRWGAANKVRSTLSQIEYEILDEEMARDAEFSRLPLAGDGVPLRFVPQ